MVAVDSATRLTQYIDEQNIILSKLSQVFEDDRSTKVGLLVICIKFGTTMHTSLAI